MSDNDSRRNGGKTSAGKAGDEQRAAEAREQIRVLNRRDAENGRGR